MPVGANGGNNLNVFMFEVGMIIADPNVEEEEVVVISLHVLDPAPSQVSYSDVSSSAVNETLGSSLRTGAGRGLRDVAMSGTFGVEARGIGFLHASGEIRFQRFYNEVVRLGEALLPGEVEDVLGSITSSPGTQNAEPGAQNAKTLDKYRPDTTQFFINFYDFWNKRRFEVQVVNWRDGRQHLQGGATGLMHYSMNLKEVGPLVTTQLSETLLVPLMNGLTVWDDINDLIRDFDVGDIQDAALGLPAIGLAALAQGLGTVNEHLAAVTQVMGGSVSPTPGGQTSFLAAAGAARREADELARRMQRLSTGEYDNAQGQIDWRNLVSEGTNAELENWLARRELHELAEANGWQRVAGVLYGMSRAEYQAFITAGGQDGSSAPDVGGSIEHVVTSVDDSRTLETAYGVDFQRILDLNRLLPDEALVVGTALNIPQIRPRGSQSIDGLPTFGSHVGQAAWGVDLDLEVRGDSDGKPVRVSGPDVLEQGVLIMSEIVGEQLLTALETVLPVTRDQYLIWQLKEIYTSDRRILTVREVNIETSSGGLALEVSMAAINGGTIRTGRGAE